MSTHDFDLFVIGGGSGGVRAARIAASHGAKVAVAEEYRYGGTCVIRGCVPKKLFVYASQFSAEFEDAAGFGWTVGPRSFDWKTLVANKDKEIGRLEKIYASNLEKAGVTVLHERAEIVGPHEILLKKQSKTRHRPPHPGRHGRRRAQTRDPRRRAWHHLERSVSPGPAAGLDRRPGRRLHRRRVRGHLQRTRRQDDASLSRPANPARLRRRHARQPRRGDAQAGHRRARQLGHLRCRENAIWRPHAS